MNDSDMIVDQIYEASIIPDLWMSVLDSIAGVVDGLGSIMAIRGADGWGDWKSSDELVNFMVKFTNSNIPLRTETTTR